jgi:hypothetical protein
MASDSGSDLESASSVASLPPSPTVNMTPDQLNQLIAAVLSAVTRAATTGTPSQGTTATPVETPQLLSSSIIQPIGGWEGVSTNAQRKSFGEAIKPPDGFKPLTLTIANKEKVLNELRTRSTASAWSGYCSIPTTRASGLVDGSVTKTLINLLPR